MADPLPSVFRPSPAPTLAIFERLAPPPPDNVVAAELTARTTPGDVVIDLHGRGGWVARRGIEALRRIYDCESSGLTRLLADVVLRPPDLRHFDAAVATLAAHPRGQTSLRQALNEPFSSTCPTCARTVIVDEFIWEGQAAAPVRRVFRCPYCRDQARGQEQRNVVVEQADIDRLAEIEERPRAREQLRARFPLPAGEPHLAEELLDLFTPRTLVALEALIGRLDSDLRAAQINSALRLALAGTLLPASRLHSYPGRVAALRIQQGHIRPLGDRQWRERNPWLVFEEQCRHVRTLIARVAASTGTFQPRAGEDLDALIDGTANVILRSGSAELPDNTPAFSPLLPQFPGRIDPRSRVRLVLTQPPVRWTTENLSFAYLATAMVLGRDEAARLPLGGIFGPPPRSAWGREASALRRSLLAVRPVLASDANAVVILDRTGPSGLVAGVLGGVGAGFRLSSAVLAEVGPEIEGVLEFSLRDTPPAEQLPAEHAELARLAVVDSDEPFALAAVEAAVSDVAVAVLQARGEPARFERLLGEVLIGLDRLGHLRRLVATQTFHETEATVDTPPAAPLPPEVEAQAGPDSELAWLFPRPPMAPGEDVSATAPDDAVAAAGLDAAEVAEAAQLPVEITDDRLAASDEAAAHGAEDGVPDAAAPAAGHEPAADDAVATTNLPTPAWALGERAATDHVRLFMEIVMGELRRPDHPRLVELEPGRWWLRDEDDIAQARPALSDRLEWAIFGLLSTSRGISEDSFFERVARMYRGFDTPDEEMVRAILDSYRDPASSAQQLATRDELQPRHAEHGAIVGMLVEYGHRLGLRAWAGPREQRRAYRDRTVADLLSEEEQRVYLPLIAAGDPAALENTDCIWYLRGKATFLFEVEWTAIISEPLERGRRIPTDDKVVRFLVVPDERIELIRLKLARSPLLRAKMHDDNWHILKWGHVRRLHAQPEASFEQLAPLLGLDPEAERNAEQLAFFG
jgi:hypothetical protein